MGDSKDNQFNIMPQAGFLVTDHIAVGAQFGYMSSKSETNSNTTSETNTFMAGAYGKWICSPDTQFTPYLGVGFNYVNEKEKVSDITYDGFEVGAGAGLIYGLNEHFYLGANYALLSYSTLKSDVDGADARNTFNFGLDWKQLSFSLGYRF
jgi:outer membrane protein W